MSSTCLGTSQWAKLASIFIAYHGDLCSSQDESGDFDIGSRAGRAGAGPFFLSAFIRSPTTRTWPSTPIETHRQWVLSDWRCMNIPHRLSLNHKGAAFILTPRSPVICAIILYTVYATNPTLPFLSLSQPISSLPPLFLCDTCINST